VFGDGISVVLDLEHLLKRLLGGAKLDAQQNHELVDFIWGKRVPMGVGGAMKREPLKDVRCAVFEIRLCEYTDFAEYNVWYGLALLYCRAPMCIAGY
jgi:hypothetical protein